MSSKFQNLEARPVGIVNGFRCYEEMSEQDETKGRLTFDESLTGCGKRACGDVWWLSWSRQGEADRTQRCTPSASRCGLLQRCVTRRVTARPGCALMIPEGKRRRGDVRVVSIALARRVWRCCRKGQWQGGCGLQFAWVVSAHQEVSAGGTAHVDWGLV